LGKTRATLPTPPPEAEIFYIFNLQLHSETLELSNKKRNIPSGNAKIFACGAFGDQQILVYY
jgi:hypothetical protein